MNKVTPSQRTYIAIDLKSFYASVECVERGLDPLTTHLVVADASRTEKTICLAVSPSLKAYGIGGRARLFEVVQRVRQVNYERRSRAGWRSTGKSADETQLRDHPDWELDYIVAPPRMARYMEVSTQVYQTYLKYIAPEDIHVYSIDEVFMDVTAYLATYKFTPHQLAMRIIRDVLAQTGITATAGIGTNMYLAKVAMDIVAKHVVADQEGVRIAELDEMSYRRQLWDYRPLTAFWRVGRGISAKLAGYGINTMGQIARRSLHDEDFFYRLFGVNAELLIDHAWGWEPCTIDYVKAYRPETNSLSSGQVLPEPYDWEKACVVLKEMADAMSMKLFAKGLATDQLVLTVNYDVENLTDASPDRQYRGEIVSDHYGRMVPKPAHGTERLSQHTSSSKTIIDAAVRLFERIINPQLLVRRITLTTNNVVLESRLQTASVPRQLDLFTDYEEEKRQQAEREQIRARERSLQAAQLAIKQRFGKNAILRGVSYSEGATAKSRNEQIGGHKA